MKYSIILLLVVNLFANENPITSYFNCINEFVENLHYYGKVCGDLPLKEECWELEGKIKKKTLGKLSLILDESNYEIWENYFTTESFHTCAYNEFYKTTIHEILKVHDDVYVVHTEEEKEVHSYTFMIHEDKIIQYEVINDKD